jgi:hypothetical protein
MYPSFESLAIIDVLGLHAYLMNFHHNTSLRYILDDDSISLAFRAYIHFYSSKGAGLVARSFIHLFHITDFTFTSTLHFFLGLI